MTILIKHNHPSLSKFVNVLIMIALVLAINSYPAGQAHAASTAITVNTIDDNLKAGDGLCTLREAILNANANNGTSADCSKGVGIDTINFASSLGTTTIVLLSALPIISDPAELTIYGAGRITVSGNDLYRDFNLSSNAQLVLSGLTIAHGMNPSSGGGAYVSTGATLTVLNSTFSNDKSFDVSSVTGGFGGAIDNHGTLNVTNGTFTANTTETTGLVLVGSGGAIYNSGTANIAVCAFSANSAGFGGAIRTVSGSSISMQDCTFSYNSAGSYGGAIYNYTGTLAIKTSTFANNTAPGGGAIFNSGGLTLVNSTFYNNTASLGGGIVNSITLTSGSATIYNSTFSANSATGNNGSGGGGVYNDATLFLYNTIIANSPNGGDCVDNNVPNPNSVNNLIKHPTIACGLTNAVHGNIVGQNPNLGAATSEAGSTVFFPLNGGSPAIDAGSNAICNASPVNTTAQNSQIRPQGVSCDIGSYEADVTPPKVISITRTDADPTTAASVHFTVTFSEPVYSSINTIDWGGAFVLTKTGLTNTSISAVNSISTSVYTVTVSTGSGSGTLRLDVVDRDTILDTANLYLGGTGWGNGNFSGGQVYSVRPVSPITTPTPPSYPIFLPLLVH